MQRSGDESRVSFEPQDKRSCGIIARVASICGRRSAAFRSPFRESSRYETDLVRSAENLPGAEGSTVVRCACLIADLNGGQGPCAKVASLLEFSGSGKGCAFLSKAAMEPPPLARNAHLQRRQT